jgi:hypothetical protein
LLGPALLLTKRRINVTAGAILLAGLAVYVSRAWVVPAFGESLVCNDKGPVAATLLLDNFDNDFGLFRRAAELQRTAAARRVLVPITAPAEPDATLAAREVASAFARVTGLAQWDMIPVLQQEPISLHTAKRVRDFLVSEQISDVTLLSSRYRSRRSDLIYRAVLSDRGIKMTCMPLWEVADPAEWTGTWHGIQNAVEQFLKLQYYRFWVMPVRYRSQ